MEEGIQFKTLHTHVLTRYPGVKEIVMDLGQAFVGKLKKALAQLFGIKKFQTTPYRPEGNSPAELLNRELILSLRHHGKTANTEWPSLLPAVLLAFCIASLTHLCQSEVWITSTLYSVW